MSEYKKKIIELIESNLTGYEISKKTGVSQYVLSQLRQGKREVDNLVSYKQLTLPTINAV
ncbi:hypothetical protein GF540_11240 [Staphylococcus aureus]|uniref:hypothetical protein n=1 Tax=Staphylococcus aureus TaxID=1280 RepID=UPI0012B0C16D|nr:hypothetical protein [Staphylococcus aureus]